MDISKIIGLSILIVPISCLLYIGLVRYGIILCKKNNSFGILILTISLTIIGTFIGCMIIYKKQNPEFKFWKSIKFKKKNKIKNVIPNV